MGKVRKLLAGVLACVMVLFMNTAAFAEEKAYPDTSEVTINKLYMLVGEGSSPAETFNFTVEKTSVSDSSITDKADMPDISVGGISYEAGAATDEGTKGSTTITLPEVTAFPGVGVYTYTIKENAGNTAGVTYDSTSVTLVVTVVNDNGTLKRVVALRKDGKKLSDGDAAFTNTYSAGKLSVTKTVEGNLGDRNKYFDFQVELKGVAGKTYGTSYEVTGGSQTFNPITVGGTADIKLKHEETVTIANLPYGVTYTVTEKAVDGYETTKTGDTGTIGAASATAAFTNTKNGDIDTGINLDSLPYILVFAGVIVAAAIALISRKRRFQD